MSERQRIVTEVTPKRAFASALDWPGWSRSGKSEAHAIAAVLAYAPRYARVAERSRLGFGLPRDVAALEIIERLVGNGTTDFGAPGAIAADEQAAVDAETLRRMTAILGACWKAFDSAAAEAAGVELSKGPRGGGRDLEGIIGHVRAGEAAYLSQLGSRPPPETEEAPGAPMTRLRAAFVDTLTAVATGAELPNPRRTKKFWPARYAVRRAAWHVLDHAWEIEDRAAGAG
ncbi:MAG: hypothetical protein ABIW50_00240 [Candidatus Limnocylindria bacterium]